MIRYKAGYKYVLHTADTFTVQIFPENNITTQFVDLLTTGTLIVKRGYAWDGPSGPTLDTLNSMQASLIHDALYGLLRDGFITGEYHRKMADRAFYEKLKEDGMLKFRAKVWWRMVRRWAKKSSVKGRPILEAP